MGVLSLHEGCRDMDNVVQNDAWTNLKKEYNILQVLYPNTEYLADPARLISRDLHNNIPF